MPQTTSSWIRWIRPLLAVVGGASISWIAFVAHREVPGLDQFDLAVHETGHLVAAFMPRLVMFLAGSAAQVLFPVAMALYFGVRRRDAAAGGFCLAWAGTSAHDVAVYAGDAVRQALPLIGGGEHDWAYILGPNGFDMLDRTAGVARSIEVAGIIMAFAGVALAGHAALAGIRLRKQQPVPEPVRSGAGPDLWAAAAALPFKHEREVA